jgi:predicted nucleic acid-binding protein
VSQVLVDTSVWVDFFRGEQAAQKKLDPLLKDGRASICGAIRAEVLSGAKDRALYERLASLFEGLSYFETGDAAWSSVADLRFLLARQGTQAHLVDLLIAVTAVEKGRPLLTRDRDFVRIAQVLPLELRVF